MTEQHPVEFQAVVDAGQVLVTVKGKAGGMIVIVMGRQPVARCRAKSVNAIADGRR